MTFEFHSLYNSLASTEEAASHEADKAFSVFQHPY